MPYRTKEEKNAQAAEYRAANRERLRQRSAAYRAAHPDRVRDSSRRTYVKHAERRRAEARERHRLTDPEVIRARHRRWAASHPTRVAAAAAANGANSRARARGVSGSLTSDDLERLWESHPTCRHCGVDARGIDHIVRMASGGENTPANLQNLCISCNVAKEWRDRRTHLVEAS